MSTKKGSQKEIKKERGKYSKESLIKALEAIKKGASMSAAAQKYQVPRTTLFNRKRRNYTICEKRPGPDSVLTKSEETLLVQWLKDSQEAGLLVSKQHLLDSVSLIVEFVNRQNPFKEGKPGKHWYQSFLSRNPNIHHVIKKHRTLTKLAATEEGVKKWFVNVRKTLEEKNLKDIHPSRIFTTGTVTLMSPSGTENVENLYVQVTGNAAGVLAPPMVVNANQRIPPAIFKKLPEDWICGKSNDECMTPATFYDYVTNCFQPWLAKCGIELPVILYMEGQLSYLTLPLSDFCKTNQIQIVALLPNSDSILHSLEATLLPSLKRMWVEALMNYRLKTGAVTLLKEDVCPLLKSVLDRMDIEKELIEGFELCGIHPLSEAMVNYHKIPKRYLEKPKKVDAPENAASTSKQKYPIVEYVPPSSNTVPILHISNKTAITSSNKDLLAYLEQQMDIVTLHTFKKVKEDDLWNGRVEDTSLFYLWRKLLNTSKTEPQTVPKIIEVQPSTSNVSHVTNTTYYTSNPVHVTPSITGYHHPVNEVLEFQMNNSQLVYDPIKLCMTHINDM